MLPGSVSVNGLVAQWMDLNDASIGAQLLSHCLETCIPLQAGTICQSCQVAFRSKECLLTDDFC